MSWLAFVSAMESVLAAGLLVIVYARGIPSLARHLVARFPSLNRTNTGCGVIGGYAATVLFSMGNLPVKSLSLATLSVGLASLAMIVSYLLLVVYDMRATEAAIRRRYGNN